MTEKELFYLIFDFGETILINGGEIKRVELMLDLLGEYFKFKNFNSFVMINGIFITAETENGIMSVKVKDISVKSINLDRIDKVNNLSRRLCQGDITTIEARKELQLIKEANNVTIIFKFLAYCIGSACFCYIFGGTIFDSMGAFFLGGILATYKLIIVSKIKLSAIINTISSSFLVTILAITLVSIFSNLTLNSLIIGGIISMVPGVPLANGIRYLFDEDYTSGWTQLITALMTALYISVGVGTGLQLVKMMFGDV